MMFLISASDFFLPSQGCMLIAFFHDSHTPALIRFFPFLLIGGFKSLADHKDSLVGGCF